MLNSNDVFNNLRSDLESAEQERLKRLEKIKPYKKFFLFCVAIGIAGLLYSLLVEEVIAIGIYPAIIVLGLIIFGVKSAWETRKFKEYFQNNIAVKIIEFLGPDFSYEPQGKLPESLVKGSGFFRSFNRFDAEDLVKGKIGDRKVEYGEIKLVKETTKSGQSSSSSRKTIFEGIFLILELNASFPAPVWILPGNRISPYHDIDRKSGEEVSVQHEPFNKKHFAFSYHTQFARKLLTPTILDRLMDLDNGMFNQKITDGPISYLFRENQIMLAIPLKGKFMEPKLEEAINTKEFIEKQLFMLNSIHMVVEKLN